MSQSNTLFIFLSILLFSAAAVAQETDPGQIRQQVADTERAFAATMANRDHEAFKSFLSEEAIFFSENMALRGALQVAEAWKPFFEGPDAPFSWAPETVEVLDSGKLALSSGPVWDASGGRIGTFTSIWRLEAPGTWRIIFDKGNKACDEAPAEGQ